MFCYLYYLLQTGAIIYTLVLQCIVKHYAITDWVYIFIVIQIIKLMPPYWDNKALLTRTLSLPITLFSTVWLFL